MSLSDENNEGAENAGIASYRYVIYKDLAAKEDLVYYDSGWKNLKDQTQIRKDVAIKLDSMGTYYVKGWVYNRSGNSAKKVSGKVELTYTLSCKEQIEFDPDNWDVNTWTNKDINVNVEKKGAVDSFDVELLNTSVDTNTTSSSKVVTGNITKQATVNLNQDGKNKLKVTCYDVLGNKDETTSDDYNIDKIKPTCSITRTPNNSIAANPGNWANDTFTIRSHCNDQGGSKCKQDSVDVTINPKTDGFRNISDSNYEVTSIYDQAGNERICSTPVYTDAELPDIIFKVYDTNTSDPSASPLSSYKNTSSDLTSDAMAFGYVKISISDSNSEIGGYRIKSNGAIIKEGGGSDLSDYPLAYTSNGTYTITVSASDRAGNDRTETLKLKIDSSRPNLSIKCVKKTSCSYNPTSLPSSNDGSYIPGTWSKNCIYCLATSGSGVSIQNQICGAGANTSSLSSCLDWESKKYRNINANGQSKVSFKATKDNGLYTAYPVNINIDTKKPTVSMKMTKRDKVDDSSSESHDQYINNTWTNKYITMYATPKDTDSGVKTTEFFVKKGSATLKDTEDQGKWLTGTSRKVNAQGVSQVKVRVIDNVGNIKETNYYTIKMDHSKPTITSVSVDNNKISFKAKDSISGIQSYCVKLEDGDCDNDSGYIKVTNTAGKEFSKTGIAAITTSKKTALKAGTKYMVVVKDQVGNTATKTVSTSLSLVKLNTWDDKYCTLHNGGVYGRDGNNYYGGGSSFVECSGAVTKSNCCNSTNNCSGYRTNNHGENTYANMRIKSLSSSISGNDLKITLQINIANGYWGTYSNGYNRYMCLKKDNRTFTNADCASNTQQVKTSWGGNGGSTTITKTFTIENYNTKKGSYSFKMWGDTYKTSCSYNVNALDQIYSFQTGYLFELK